MDGKLSRSLGTGRAVALRSLVPESARSHEVSVRGFKSGAAWTFAEETLRPRRGACVGRLIRSNKHRQREVIEPWHEPLPLDLLDNALHQGHRQGEKESEDHACDDE